MCGIVGAASNQPGSVDPALVREMCSLIRRRGPDDEGFFFADRVALGMRRLAIIDVHSGRQPIYNEDRTISVVFNGEIYNFRELREDLLQRGHRLETSSDTECLVHLYEEYGETFVSHLRGMFAFAIWDDSKKRLVLGRDRLGIKPYYYWQHGDTLYFGSELKCLLAVPEFPRQIDVRALSDYLTYKYVPGPRTIYKDIREIPPAHVGVWQDGKLSLSRYWQVDHLSGPEKSVDYYADGLLHHLEEAVRLHLVSEVPIGAFLSGGIDSSAIVALMSRVGEGRVKTFTIGFDSKDVGVDERPFARSVAEQFGTEHSEYVYEDPQAQIVDMLPSIMAAFDEPFADSSVIPNYMVSEAARKFVTVALSGTGGDELFAGYERYRGALAAEKYKKVPRFLRRALVEPVVNGLLGANTGSLWADRAARFVSAAELPLPLRYQQFLSAFSEAEKSAILHGDVVNALQRDDGYQTQFALNRVRNPGDPLEWMLAADQATYLPDDELRKTDRLSMWHSLEVRVPLLDHKVVEFAASIPSHYKLKGMTKKYVVLKALQNLLSPNILGRRKQGFSIPLAQWLRGPLRQLMRDYLSADRIEPLGLLRPDRVAVLVNEHERGIRNHETKLWVLLTLAFWWDHARC